MPTTSIVAFARTATLVAIVGAAFSFTPGCGTSGSQRTAAPSGRAFDAAILVDGVVDDWPLDRVAVADAHYLYIRFLIEGEPKTLQASTEPTALRFDLDDDPSTGVVFDDPPEAQSMGVDLEILLSPPDEETGLGTRGSLVRVYDDEGEPAEISHADIDFHFAPTFASTWFEARIARRADASPALEGLLGGSASGMVAVLGPGGAAEGWSAPFRVEMPPAAGAAPLADVSIPPKPAGSARVVSWNVLFASPMQNPRPFARVLRALDPDVVLFQEWDVEDPILIRQWLNSVLPRETSWSVRSGDAWGVVVATPYPMEPIGTERLVAGGEENPVRMIAARVDTPAGPVDVASVHLKCCGGPEGEEEMRRLSEADAIAGELAPLFTSEMRVVAGDVNLVGGREPLERLRAGLDVDGSDLAVARALRLGDASMYTWWNGSSEFTPGRLDYALVSDAETELVQAFVFDPRQLTESAARAAGVQPDDGGASDHLPVVVDIRPR